MKPGRLNLPIIWRGCDWPPVIFRWKDQKGNPFDLTGWTPSAATNRFDLGAVVSDTAGGVVQLSLSKDETANLSLGEQLWSWLFTSPTGEVLTPLLEGTVTVREPTTLST